MSSGVSYSGDVSHGIAFHHFYGHGHPKGQGDLSAETFDSLLRFIGLERILSPAEWLRRLAEDTLQPSDVCLTFDDGLLCQFELALPVLEHHQLTAFWFVYSGVFEGQVARPEVYRAFQASCFPDAEEFFEAFLDRVFRSRWAVKAQAVIDPGAIAARRRLFPFYSVNDAKFRLVRDRALDRQAYESIMEDMMRDEGFEPSAVSARLWMSNDHLRHLSERGHHVGLHSYSHPMVLASLSLAAQREEYAKNAAHLTSVCGRSPVAVAHPANSYTPGTLAVLKQLGIRCGFRSTMIPAREGGPINPSALELAREDPANIASMLHR